MKVNLKIDVDSDELTDGMLTREQVEAVGDICSEFLHNTTRKMKASYVDEFSIDLSVAKPPKLPVQYDW